MKKSLLVIILTSSYLWGNFNFGECSGSGTFEQEIVYYEGDYEKVATVGEIPAGIKGLKVSLTSDKDVDIRLYGENEDKIVHWPYGILNKYGKETKLYQDVNITYSGYNGEGGEKGNEYIEVNGTTPVTLTMKAFGYRAGYATVNYSWTGKDDCEIAPSGEGTFQQNILNKDTTLVGTIPPNINNVYIELNSTNDIDIQLYAQEGTALVAWHPTGLISGPSKQMLTFKDMIIEWSGYNGTNGQQGNEYIKISGATSEMLVMKVYGYQAGEATVHYTWGKPITNDWRTEYLDNAKLELITKYREEYNETLPMDTYTWIVNHGFENSLLQSTEVDPRIVKNVHEILAGLSFDVSEEYANIIFAISVARRIYGVDSFNFNNNRFSKIPKPVKDKDIKKSEIEKKYSELAEAFIDDNDWDFNQSIEHLDTILNYLQTNGGEDAKFSKDVEQVANYIHMIKDRKGLTKPRSNYASVIEYINHLATIQKETIPPFKTANGEDMNSANIFPHDGPWPLLMPLAEVRPVDEMQWIWNNFKDETLEPKYRFRQYGNYRKPPEVIAPYIVKSNYSKGSVEYMNYVGGICGTMSQIGRATEISLGIPCMGTGQPGHACVTRYRMTSDNQYLVSVEQTITTLYNSTPDWQFFEDDSFRMDSARVSYGEYQMGLALAMNNPLQEYLDSRTLVRLANAKEDDEKKELLQKATEASIYNAEAVYDRFDAMGRDFSSLKTLVDDLFEKLPVEADGYSAPKAADEDLVGEDINVSLDTSVVQYRDSVIGALISEFFKDNYLNQVTLSSEYTTWIKEMNIKSSYDLMRFYSFEAFDYISQKKLKYLKLLDADSGRSKELKRQKKNIKYEELKAEYESLIAEKNIEYSDENTSQKRKDSLQKQIERLTAKIVDLNAKIEKNDEETLLYRDLMYGDGLV